MKLRTATCVCLLACVHGAALAQRSRGDGERLGQQAGKLYTTAASAYRTGQWQQARDLLEQFVKKYATHEYVPVAYLQLAFCRHHLKDFDGYEAALDEVVRRFAGSPAWFCAYGSKLGRAATLKDHERYLTLLEEFLQRAKQAPLDLHGSIRRHFGDYIHGEYSQQGLAFEPTAGRMRGIGRKSGWVMTIVKVADTPERARRALAALAKTLQTRRGELPADWQFAHVLLLRKAGEADEAEKAFRDYANRWGPPGEDPRAIDLWLLRAADAQARNDLKTVQDVYQRLLSQYGGCESLSEPLRLRLWSLCRDDEYDSFTELARHYLKAYSSSRYYDQVVGLWVGLAKANAQKGDGSRIPGTLKMLKELAATDHPLRARANLIRTIELTVLAGEPEAAAKLAAELISPQQWSAEPFRLISRYAVAHKPFAEVLDAARRKWKVPLPNPAGEAFVLLNRLKLRLKDQGVGGDWSLDQVRHAEETGEEMYAKHRQDAATIEAVKLLADYYFKKVLPAPRDKWMSRMVQTYPYHPLTQEVLSNQIVSERAARRYDRLAAALDTLAERFPPAAAHWGWYQTRLSCYDAAKDAEGKKGFVRRFYGARAEAGEIEAIQEIAKYEHAALVANNEAVGDDWLAKAERFAATAGCRRTALYCLAQAWAAYYWVPYYHQRQPQRVRWEKAQQAIAALQTQKQDPELRWKTAFADVNLLGHKGEGKAVLAAIKKRLRPGRSYRDLSLRLDFAAVGSALGRSGLLKEGIDLARRLKKDCRTARDAAAIELMQAAMHAAIKGELRASSPSADTSRFDLAAAGHYLKIVEDCPWPIRRYAYFLSAMHHLREARSPRYLAETDRYITKIAKVQEKVPELMYQVAYELLGARDRGALQVREKLQKRYPASAALDRLNAEIARRGG